MPFISEYLYQKLSKSELENSESIMIKQYPISKDRNKKIEEKFALIKEAIVSIRRAKAIIDKGNSKIEKAYVKGESGETDKIFIQKLAKVEDVEFTQEKVENSVSDIADSCETFIPTKSIDLTPIINKLRKQDEKLQKEMDKLNGMLNNERFVANAPEDEYLKYNYILFLKDQGRNFDTELFV